MYIELIRLLKGNHQLILDSFKIRVWMTSIGGRIMRKFLLMVAVFLVVFLIFSATTSLSVKACEGFPEYIEDGFKAADVVVKARFVEIDDQGQNGIVRVEKYFKGQS